MAGRSSVESSDISVTELTKTGYFSSYSKRELFGGAITVDLPNVFVDFSAFRQIPDNEELYMDQNSSISVVVDLSERVGGLGAGSDEMAFGIHVEDIADSQDPLCVREYKKVTLGSHPLLPAYTVVATNKPVTSIGGICIKLTTVIMLLVRLETKETDIVVTVNLPFDGTLTPFFSTNRLQGEIVENIIKTFSIEDWGLFSSEE